MSFFSNVLEFLDPGRMHRAEIPPLEAGLRPNTALDTAPVLGTFEALTPDDIVSWEGGFLVSHGDDVSLVRDEEILPVAHLPGRVTALAKIPDGALAAVQGHGIFHVAPDGSATSRWADEHLRHNVTSINATSNDSFLACVGSLSVDAWEQALVRKVSDGAVIEVAGERVQVLDDGLPWPAGVLALDDGFLLSLSQDHSVQFREKGKIATGNARRVLNNLPGYPGRLVRSDDQFVVAMPYMRNRAVELMLRDESLRTDMLDQLDPDAWLIPRLGVLSEYRVPLQVGQIRVLGEVKPWAPPRSYGLAFSFTEKGLVTQSVHSRADGLVHGITGITALGKDVTLVSKGSGKVVSWKRS